MISFWIKGILKELFLTWGGRHCRGRVTAKPAGSLITFYIGGHHQRLISWGRSHILMNTLITPPPSPVLTLGTKKNPMEEFLLTQVCVRHREGAEKEVVFSCRSFSLRIKNLGDVAAADGQRSGSRTETTGGRKPVNPHLLMSGL